MKYIKDKAAWVYLAGKSNEGLKKSWKFFPVKGFDFCTYAFIQNIFQVTVLPPGEWDPSIRIEPPDVIPEQGKRLESAKSAGNADEEEHDPAGDREEQLQKTGRLEEKICQTVTRVRTV